MKGHIRYCPSDNLYTLSETCSLCGKSTITPHPARYSPEDKYGHYRRMIR
ncbi:RNA-protein complex protein Nop10 [Methanospirillum sp. J.3.6.1-F.2.7.3]|uniref:RNA-protein complex protein Nop10 n=2 Tax=Methanospirillum TaxID=2202 RepID=A0A8E7EHU1_9EURY|nr:MULTISPECIES: RNA-protein complex protein Nop10 [Methanospirillum]MDX8550053.1 RNA-protein complex protein Nop10 [Methanospirillum hungatei]NLW75667.1 RNA-protein complex protein Nop10 [Methanomicrobiales archaeon]QVV87419.1 RNA-protein complex protein Nop10 [Methanospirillum sp. J.3.6.1-F.2.7.3]QXO94882.1 RNA-protein complex protein Nop10 [Methanospirillum hungatei]